MRIIKIKENENFTSSNLKLYDIELFYNNLNNILVPPSVSRKYLLYYFLKVNKINLNSFIPREDIFFNDFYFSIPGKNISGKFSLKSYNKKLNCFNLEKQLKDSCHIKSYYSKLPSHYLPKIEYINKKIKNPYEHTIIEKISMETSK